MALSEAMQWALANGMTEEDVYNNINNWTSQFSNASDLDRQNAMAQYGISDADVADAQSRLTKVIPGGNTVLEDKSTFDPGKSGLESLTAVTPVITGGISTLVTPVVTPVSIPVTPVITSVSPVVTPVVISVPTPIPVTPAITSVTPVVTPDVTVVPTPVVTVPTPAVDTGTFNYESVYDAFGGKDATDALIAQIRALGLSDSQIAQVLAPYQKTTVVTPVITPIVSPEATPQVSPTPVVTPVVIPSVTPVVTPIATTVVTPVVLGSPVVSITPIVLVTPVVSITPVISVTPVVTPVVTPIVTPTPAVEALVTPTVSPSAVSINTLAVAGSDGNLLNIPGYGELSTSTP